MVFCRLFERAKMVGQKPLVPTPAEPGIYIIYEDERLSECIRHFNNLVRKGAKGFVASPFPPSELLNRSLGKFLGYVLFLDARARKHLQADELITRTPHLEIALAKAKEFIIGHKNVNIVILFDAFQLFTGIEKQGFYDVKEAVTLLGDYITAHKINCVVLARVPPTDFFIEQKPILKRTIPATILE